MNECKKSRIKLMNMKVFCCFTDNCNPIAGRCFQDACVRRGYSCEKSTITAGMFDGIRFKDPRRRFALTLPVLVCDALHMAEFGWKSVRLCVSM